MASSKNDGEPLAIDAAGQSRTSGHDWEDQEVLRNNTHLGSEIRGSEDDSNDGSSDTDYHSFGEDSDDDQATDETKGNREAREIERQMVLQAAGFIVKKDVQPPPRPPRTMLTKRQRRPAPATPGRSSVSSFDKDLPTTPDTPEDPARRLDDAFDRYESFRQTHANVNLNRLSVASIETTGSSSSPTSTLAPTGSNRDSTYAPSLTTVSAASRDSESSRHSQFFNFLGKLGQSSDQEGRLRPVISGPISSHPATPTREDSPAFGTSWASVVGKTALDGLPPDERKRQEAIFELINTEAAYVRDLQLTVELYYAPLLPLLDEKAVKVIFANIEDLLLINTSFMSSLESRQKECRLYIDKIGDILLTHMPSMGAYLEYCVNQEQAAKVLQSLRSSRPDLAAHLQKLRDNPAVRNLDLSNYLLTPMQRMTRYPLLLRQILHYTQEPDRKDVEKSLSIGESLLNNINETIRDQEGVERLRTISQNLWIGNGRLDLTAPTRYLGPRKLIKEGALSKAKSKRKLRGFLCSDILVLTDVGGNALYRMPIPLAEIKAREVPRDEQGLQIVMAYPRGGETITLRAGSARESQAWMDSIELASKRCRDAEKRAQRKSRR